ncbi:hypothetical protein PENTCL1PPCAC_715, partial [Pristionchus entomophagus]
LREVSSTALSWIINVMPPGATSTKIALRLLRKLHGVLAHLCAESSGDDEIDSCFLLIAEVLATHGFSLSILHSETERVLVTHVVAGREAVIG